MSNSYFGPPIDILEYLANELSASARLFPEAQAAMLYLSEQLTALSPMYEAVSEYCADEYSEATEVNYLLSIHMGSKK